MEDRYLFKAKRLDNGEWEIGSIIALPDGKFEIANKCENPPDSDPMWGKCVITHIVDPSTICQCTGLKDKNGKLIWENDVIRCNYETSIVKWEKSEWRIKWIDEAVWRRDLDYWVNESKREVNVVGNIFDNPELLEV